MAQTEGTLQKKLKPRHISFMAMGGVIGTGIFKGSAETIGLCRSEALLSRTFLPDYCCWLLWP
ncbi:hypothetical protein Q0F98_22520 [Paenibacillus amylolyticus]|nr:hypothetical protein Q0F98_22520 [Paenibacillus amylolyticus]